MCGKFTAMMTWREYCDLAGTGTNGGGGGPDVMDPDTTLGTMTPMMNVPVLHLGPVRQRRITLMRWGWHNPRLANPLKGFSHLHARAETIDTAPTWMEPFQERRGIVFTNSFNIGEELPNGKIRQWVCRDPEDRPLALAVIHSAWDLVPGKLHTFVMVTTDAVAPLNGKDNRMPAIIGPDEVARWIGEEGASNAELKALLRPYAGVLVMRPQEPGKPKERNTTRAKQRPESSEPTLF
jgi:putative SOS response-associated peptidase YedK